MGGRGGNSISEKTSDRGLQKRAEGIHKILADAGMPAKESVSATVERLRKFDRDSGNTKQAMKEVLYSSHISDYERGFRRTANTANKAGYKQEKENLMNQIVRTPNQVNKITTQAQNKYRKQLDSLDRQINNASGSEYNRLIKERDTTYGKFQAANFINWARKK